MEEARFSISIREITFREKELNWLFAKYKRLENNPLYGIFQWLESRLGVALFRTRPEEVGHDLNRGEAYLLWDVTVKIIVTTQLWLLLEVRKLPKLRGVTYLEGRLKLGNFLTSKSSDSCVDNYLLI